MDHQTEIIRAELPEVTATIRDEYRLEGERREHTVSVAQALNSENTTPRAEVSEVVRLT